MKALLLEKPKTLRGQVEQALREAISSGHFLPGQRLVERELCALLNVSRPTLREAMSRLEAEGLICSPPFKGPMIPAISADEARQIYAVRALLEGFAAAEFARRITAEKSARLKTAVAELHASAKTRSRALILESKTNFYRVLLEGCENKPAADMLLSLLGRINLLRGTTLAQPERLPSSLAEIDDLCTLICRGDADGALAAAQRHVFSAQVAAMRVLEGQAAASTGGSAA